MAIKLAELVSYLARVTRDESKSASVRCTADRWLAEIRWNSRGE